MQKNNGTNIKINITRSNNDLVTHKITVIQGSEIITSHDLLLDYLKGSIPYRKGIVDIRMISDNIWKIKTNK